MPSAKLINLSGLKFGLWSAMDLPIKKKTKGFWPCQCSCGTQREVMIDNLIRGYSTSCGCIRNKKTSNRNISHGLSSTDEYRIWKGMIKRCYGHNESSYCHYGGRGIKIAPEWRHDFIQFYKDMGPRPSLKHSIDRIDNDGNYSPENCRWATRDVQANNTRRNRFLIIDGERMTMAQLAKKTGVSYRALTARIYRGKNP